MKMWETSSYWVSDAKNQMHNLTLEQLFANRKTSTEEISKEMRQVVYKKNSVEFQGKLLTIHFIWLLRSMKVPMQ